MKGLILTSTALLGACSQLPVQKAAVDGAIVRIEAREYAVFAEEGAAMAVLLGVGSEGASLGAAQQAIEFATGCQVVAKSLVSDLKTTEARVACKTFNPPKRIPNDN